MLSLVWIALSASAVLPAHAADAARREAKEVINLQDGGALYIFSDGKMAKEGKYGYAEVLRTGTTLQTADGNTIKVTSNEVMRLSGLLEQGHRGGD